MKKILCIFYLISFSYLSSQNQNLIILLDTIGQETSKSSEINITHQCITALQQKSGSVLITASLWKNITERKKHFIKELEDYTSLESKVVNLYQRTNQDLKASKCNISLVNKQLSESWYQDTYPSLASLSKPNLDQVKFDFLCYNFDFDMSQWHIYNSNAGMILFVPDRISLILDSTYKIKKEQDMVKHIDKKAHLVESLQNLFTQSKDQWVVYISGHGHPESILQRAHISGLSIEEFQNVLRFLDESISTKLLVYSSCYGAGVHSIEPYEGEKFNYPIIVIALTDAPTYGFGLFEGVKLPPYNNNFQLEAQDVSKICQLKPHLAQDYQSFFNRAYQGLFDMTLIQYISKFFMCDQLLCDLYKIENFPLIRKSQSSIFIPIEDALIHKFVKKTTSNEPVMTDKPLLLYNKKIKSIQLHSATPIISMLPGMQSHEIGAVIAKKVLLSDLIKKSFLSLSDAQLYKNFMIQKISCINDVIKNKDESIIHNCMILNQQNFMPSFLTDPVQTLVYFELENESYLVFLNDQKFINIMTLSHEQMKNMLEIKKYLQKSIDYQADLSLDTLLTHDMFLKNKFHQLDIAQACLSGKICKKL